MRFDLLLFGVPIGTIDTDLAGLVIAPLAPLAGYSDVRDQIRHHSERLERLGFFSEKPARIAVEALAPPPELSFELHEASGALVQAEFVNVVESATGRRPLAIVKLHGASAAVESLLRSLPRAPGFGERPEA